MTAAEAIRSLLVNCEAAMASNEKMDTQAATKRRDLTITLKDAGLRMQEGIRLRARHAALSECLRLVEQE